MFPAAYIAAGGQGLSVPELIDFGDCPTGISTYPGIYMKEFRIRNNSDKTIYLSHISIDLKYPKYISQRGNYLTIFDRVFKYGTPERILIPGDSAGFSIWYRSSFADTISMKGYLQAELVYTYHYESDLQEIFDTSNVRMRSINKDSLFSSGDFYETWSYCEERAVDYYWDLFITIYNKTNTSYIIDSIKHDNESVFEVKGLFENSYMSELGKMELPYELKEDGVSHLFATIKFPGYSLNKIKFNIFCRNKESGIQNILIDSLIFNVNQPQPAIMQNGASYLVAYLGDTIYHEGYLRVYHCSDDSLSAESVAVEGDLGLNEYSVIPYGGDLPRWLDYGTKGLSKIGSIEFIAKELGGKQGSVIGNFRDVNGNQYVRYAPFSIYVLAPVTSVSETESKNNEIIVYPNPAADHINIYLKNYFPELSGSIKIYNSIGQKVIDYQPGSSYSRIELNKLSNGVYFIAVTIKNKIHSIPIVIQK